MVPALAGVATLGLAIAVAGQAHAAAPAPDCGALHGAALRVEVGPMRDASRSISLEAGDRVTFGVRGEPGAVKLVRGAGSPRALLAGPAGNRVVFVAEGRGSFVFQFANEGAETARFTVSCVPAQRAARTLRAPGLVGKDGRGAEMPEPLEPAEVIVDAPDIERAPNVPAAPASTAQRGAQTMGPPAPASALGMKLQWRNQHITATGPDGPQIDATASGMDMGLNYKAQPQIMVGALAQFDQGGEAPLGGPRSLFDQAWMAGPVTTVTVAPGVSLDARAAWGVADGALDARGAKTAGTQRRAVSARLASAQTFGALRVTSSISVNHHQEAHASGQPAEAVIPQVVESGRIDVGPEIAYRIDLPQATFIEPRAVLGGFWSIDSLSKLAPDAATHADIRLKAEAGVTIGATDGAKLQATGGMEAGDRVTPDVWSGRLQLSVPLK